MIATIRDRLLIDSSAVSCAEGSSNAALCIVPEDVFWIECPLRLCVIKRSSRNANDLLKAESAHEKARKNNANHCVIRMVLEVFVLLPSRLEST